MTEEGDRTSPKHIFINCGGKGIGRSLIDHSSPDGGFLLKHGGMGF
jgi:hypothetical protein